MQDRKEYIPGVNYREFGETQRDLVAPLKMRIMISEYEGEPISSIICSAIGNTGIYILGATGDKGMKLKGSYLLQWKMIEWLKNNGYEWYDLGGINPERNPGVYQFKAGLSGVEVNFIGQYELCVNPISLIVVKSKEKWDEHGTKNIQ